MRQTKYIPKYGYVSGGSIFSSLFSHLPPSIITAAKNAATSAATAGISAVGSRVGSELANRIAPKSQPDVVLHPSKTVDILRDLKLNTEIIPKTHNPMGFGVRKKIRGKGIKILI